MRCPAQPMPMHMWRLSVTHMLGAHSASAPQMRSAGFKATKLICSVHCAPADRLDACFDATQTINFVNYRLKQIYVGCYISFLILRIFRIPKILQQAS